MKIKRAYEILSGRTHCFAIVFDKNTNNDEVKELYTKAVEKNRDFAKPTRMAPQSVNPDDRNCPILYFGDAVFSKQNDFLNTLKEHIDSNGINTVETALNKKWKKL